MSRRKMAIAALMFASPALIGCSSLFGPGMTRQVKPVEPGGQGPADYAATQIELGRSALDQKQYGQALVRFRNAQRMPEHAAAAHNGMAIAYAQIGRPDLAERFFKQAMSEAPGERRYQVNLENFYHNWPEIAVRSVRPEALAAAAPAAPAPIQARPVEVVVSAAQAQPAPVANLETRFDAAIQRRIASALQAQTSPVVRGARPAAWGADARLPILSNLRRAIAAVMPRQTAPARGLAGRSDAMPNRGATIRIELPESRTMRVSANEVHIAAPQPRAGDSLRGKPALGAAPGYPARIVMGSGQ